MSRWSVQQVLDAAPDASSIAAARKLATPGPWTETGSTDSLLWGKCQGSGKTPYQVSIDLDRPAYRCSCPSRKFPCKHGIALMLLWAQSDDGIADVAQAADFAAEWAAGVQAAKATREAKADKPVDPAVVAEDDQVIAITLPKSVERISPHEAFTADEVASLFESFYQRGEFDRPVALRPVEGYRSDGGYVDLSGTDRTNVG